MYKVIYFLLVAAISACLYIGSTQENMALIVIGLLAGPVLTLVWGVVIKAGAGRIILAILLSLIPGIGPWIGFLMLVRKTPNYTGAGARLFRWSVLLGLLFLLGGVLLLIQFFKLGGASNLSETWSALIVILVLFLLSLAFLWVGDWLLKAIGTIVKFLINAYYFLLGLLILLGILVAGVGLIIGSVMNGITENWPRLILGLALVIGDLLFIRWMIRKAVMVYHAEQEQAARRAAQVNLPREPEIPAPPVPVRTGPITADEVVADFNAALANRNPDEQERLLALRAPCPHCGKQVSVMEAWMVRRDNTFACPLCKLAWS
jgi:hypothetical protein